MGTFQWLMKKITKIFGRSTNGLFYTLLYREILKEVNEISNNEEESLLILREIGKNAAYESCERHSSIFKFMPGNPKKILDYFEILWVVVFGMELDDYSYEEIPKEGAKYNDYILKIKKCPICAGYGQDIEDTFDFNKLKDIDSEGMACGLAGMLESVANFILKVKRNDYRIQIIEQRCITKGDEHLQFICKIYDYKEWSELKASKVKDKISSSIYLEESIEEEIVQETKLDIIDKLQDIISIDKLDEYLDEPLEGIKERVSEFIKDKLNMEPKNFFDYFRNYEDDMIRIIGYLGLHLLNEYGGLLEKNLKNEWFAKILGYLFKQMKEMTLLFIPLDVIRDYNELLVNFLEGLAPTEMVENIKLFTGRDTINYLFEGTQMALENLGIDFSELKENIWEELQKERENGLISSEISSIEKTREKIPQIVNILQEFSMIIIDILTLPIRVLISESHYGIKTAINSVVSEEEGLYGSIRERFDKIFNQIQEIRK
ncbi:hypothetical protein LCGC14_0790420 [marine sediment metagenome]|uniref:Uncharacterized protein n=1 Tax=marine sediment metagenome TaxID=412755 RepID=A0A0F9PX46_9ZZZZ